jgi:hypothetical protein
MEMRLIEVETAVIAYKLYLDLDGVFCDFEKGVEEVTGKKPKEQPIKHMWSALARTPDFYAKLDWMPGSKELWQFCRQFNPEILTGIPMGNWAPKQKRVWVGRNLGWNVVAHTVWARDKYKFAAPNHVLLDDTKKNIDAWKAAGGIGVLHVSPLESIRQLMELGFK